ncbi:Crotonobetainyl-CoA:carnitine CoA-transferase CaiB [Gemmobacter aquatilis]|uniref:Crotonobetainyl-CoA:carnitine CoA-transferase CaiB n=1 Tax=Gemmobacter aquatilis TaxID=933059 RepID=A0A1H8MDM4_9RHOB|nr:CoA transferase [Gemmobacter aquatilis]SEO15423.1 Crotonobetainyl-CoA:carnitine CoA-transferase CaiB [Gemmobacter aquatilis]
MFAPPSGCLEGTVVVDASRVLAGPFAGQLLGDHGAEVIKVEAFDGDDTRRFGPPFVDGVAPYYLGLNRNKKDVAVDLTQPEGLALMFQMLETADVFIENFKASTWAKWGLSDLSEITRRFPHLVHCRVSGFGETGEFGGLPGYDAALQAMSGLMAVNGNPADDACRIGIPIVDTCTGMYGCMGILLALLERNRSGKGQMVEVTLYDTAIAMLHPHAANVLNGGKAIRTGNGHPNIVPYDLFPTGTVPLFLAVGNDRQFRNLCRELGEAGLASEAPFLTNGDRVVNRDSLRARLIPLLAPHDGMALFQRLMDLGVPCAPVLKVEEALAQAHTATREMTVECGDYRGPGIAVKLGRTPGAVHLPPPAIGEHSREVLARFGLGAARVEELIAAKVVI